MVLSANEHARGASVRLFPKFDVLSYEDFLANHLLPNLPLVLSSSTTSHWKACKSWRLWTSPVEPGLAENNSLTPSCSLPNLSAFRQYSHHLVPVADTRRPEYSDFERSEPRLGNVLDLWDEGQGEGLYVKDWHLVAEIEGEGRGMEEVYEVPEVFRDDWMNPPYTPNPRDSPLTPNISTKDPSSSDFRFCYLGPAGTYTPLHRDVYSSYSWSANIVGRKKWWFFTPEVIDGLRDTNGELPFDVRDVDVDGCAIEVFQEEGEVIFVPSGWYHQVLNLTFCISINHNFCSSPTLPRMFEALVHSQIRVEHSISDVKEMIQQRLGDDSGGTWEKEWTEEVQGLLERDAGWGWRGFWGMIRDNMLRESAGSGLTPPSGLRDEIVRGVVTQYKGRREWAVLEDIRRVVEEVDGLLDG